MKMELPQLIMIPESSELAHEMAKTMKSNNNNSNNNNINNNNDDVQAIINSKQPMTKAGGGAGGTNNFKDGDFSITFVSSARSRASGVSHGSGFSHESDKYDRDGDIYAKPKYNNVTSGSGNESAS